MDGQMDGTDIQQCRALLRALKSETETINPVNRLNLQVVSRDAESFPVWNSLPSFVRTADSFTIVLGLSSRLTCSQDICSRSAVRTSDTLRVFRAL